MSSIHHNTSLYIGGKALNLLIAPFALILLPGLMGDKGYGLYGYWFSLISLYLVLFDFGSQAMLRRYLPELFVINKQQATSLWLRSQHLKTIPLTLFVLALVLTDSFLVQISLLLTALAAAILTSIADLFYAVQYMGWHSASQLSRRLLRLILAPIGFLIWGLNGLLMALLFSELLPLFFWLVAKKILTTEHQSLDKPFWSYYQVGLIGFIGFFIATLMGRFPILGAQWSALSIEQVGHIALCIDLTYFALKELINAISESILPRIIQLKAKKQQSKVHNLISSNYRFVNLMGIYIIALGIPLAPAFLLMLGDQFYYITTGLQWMLVAVLLGSLNVIHNQILFIHEASIKIMLSQIIGLITLLLLFFALQDTITPVKLCLILAAAMLTCSISSYIFSRKYLSRTDSLKYFARLAPAAVSSFAILWLWQPRGILMSVVAGIVVSVVYAVMVLLFKGIAQSDLDAIKTSLHLKP